MFSNYCVYKGINNSLFVSTRKYAEKNGFEIVKTGTYGSCWKYVTEHPSTWTNNF